MTSPPRLCCSLPGAGGQQHSPAPRAEDVDAHAGQRAAGAPRLLLDSPRLWPSGRRRPCRSDAPRSGHRAHRHRHVGLVRAVETAAAAGSPSCRCGRPPGSAHRPHDAEHVQVEAQRRRPCLPARRHARPWCSGRAGADARRRSCGPGPTAGPRRCARSASAAGTGSARRRRRCPS